MDFANGFAVENGILIKYHQIPGVTDIVIPNGVTSIGDRAFHFCSSLTSIAIPESVTIIGDSAFCCCSSLTSITIPEGVTSIGVRAFYLCHSLTSVYIPNSVTSIGDQAFSCCESLASIIIPDSVKIIGDHAFSHCGNLASVTIPDSVTNIIKITACNNITEVIANPAVLPDAKWKQTAMYTFLREPEMFSAEQAEGCKNYLLPQRKRLLPEIFANDYVHVIQLFADAKKITKNNVKTEFLDPAIKAKATQCVAFLMDWENKNVSIDDREKLIEKELTKDPFNVTDMKKIWSYKKLEDGTLCMTSYKGTETDVVIPERIGTSKVTRIEKELFSPNKYGPNSMQRKVMEKLSSVFIPESIICIGDDVFSDCSKLTNINVAAGNSAYSSENGILFDKSRTEIIRYPERKTDASYIVPNSVTCIRDNAFRNCGNLARVVITDGVTSIGDSAFYECSRLANITIPESVTSIGDHAFCFCKSLTSIDIPDGVTSIGESVFNGCSSLSSITISENVTNIGDDTFSDCSSLVNVNIPDSVTSIGNRAFYGCSSLKSVNIPNGVKSIELGTFCCCDSLVSVTIPDSVKKIKGYAFSSCDGLTSVNIPNSATSIGVRAFAGCTSLSSITIPKSVSSIGEDAFNGNLTIHAARNSYAKRYAESHEIPFAATDENDCDK